MQFLKDRIKSLLVNHNEVILTISTVAAFCERPDSQCILLPLAACTDPEARG